MRRAVPPAQSPAERLRDALLQRIRDEETRGATRAEAIQALYPNSLLDDDVLESVTAALLSGTNLLLVGPPGSGKTSLAKDVWALFPKDAIVVADCPVQDDPDGAVCPVCAARHGEKKRPARAARLREGHGFARLQGSPEVFPDYLTGAINLAKLEEIGDPESPLVLEPGKLMQANRGMLIIDEMGKLPRGTQNVLLQALQEGIVTPSKSRETFPADFQCVATSNLEDMDAIEEPLIGRFTSVYVPFNKDHAKNRAIVDLALRGARLPISPWLREAAVLLVERWRKGAGESPDMGEVGSNRTMIDVLRRSEAHALLRHARVVEAADFGRGAREALVGRVRGRSAEGYLENREAVEAFLSKQLPKVMRDAAEDYWCGFFVGVLREDKGEGERTARELREAAKDQAKVEAALGAGQGMPKLRRFAQYVDDREGSAPHEVRVARLASVLRAFEENAVFEAKK
ncbi:MAG TPA: ATP-binding protein [Candidatus Thermoplasmatota archaeon]|nr:ATP-binding protein [Candidatus Thermoplasmatota archaeon]